MPNKILSPFQLLELNVISAQDLAIVSRKMRTYAMAWVHPDRKLSTRVDIQDHNNPTWNDKFVFRVDDDFLHGETSAVMIEIYALHWLRDIHVGTVRILVGNLVPPADPQNNKYSTKAGTRFVALQVRRASGRPQGILNIGVAILNSSMRSMPLYTQLKASAVGFHDLVGENSTTKNDESNNSDNNNQFLLPWYPKPELRRVKSDSSSLIRPAPVKVKKSKGSSMINESEFVDMKRNEKKSKSNSSSKVNSTVQKSSNSVITDSTISRRQRGTLNLSKTRKTKWGIGPSISEVTTSSKTNNNRQNSVVEEREVMEGWSLEEDSIEELESKLERWRSELSPAFRYDVPNSSIVNLEGGHRRLRSHDDGRAFTCFGRFCGLEVSIVCGGEGSRRNRKIKRSESLGYSTFV